jgi:tetratricopeptide (TPR) repeat protein
MRANVRLVPCLVPLPRPRSFVGRETQLAQLRASVLSEGSQRLAIYGLGGCGKTALALEFAYWMKEQHLERAIFWVPALSPDSFEQAYHEIAALLCIPGVEDDKVDVKRLVKATLSDESFGQWLIVVDNADNESVLFSAIEEGSGVHQLISYLPRSRKGSIVFTTRTRAAATKLAENKVIALGELEKAEAVEILNRRLSQEHLYQLKDNDTVHEFLSMLFFHALAIVQAIAFVNTNDITLSDYVALYRNSEGDAIDLLSEGFEDQSRYQEETNSVATTWYISFGQIQKQDSIAADHLFFMACTASNGIEPSMFPPLYTLTEHIKAMGTLKAYAFVTERQPRADRLRDKARKPYATFDVHPLVHLAIRGWLKAHRQWGLWIDITLARFIKIVPYGDYDTKPFWSTYLHHAVHVVNLPETDELEDRMTLLEKIAKCERSLGRYQAAERSYRQALEQRKRMSGKEHPDTLMTMGNIGQVLAYQERWAEAERMHQEESTLMKKVLGEEHPHTITSKDNLALSVLGQGRCMEAEKLHRDVLLLDKKVHGEKHPETLTTMHNIGAALCGQGKYADAEQIHRQTLALSIEVRGKEHVNTLTSMSALGTALSHQSKYAAAEMIHTEELELRKKVMGEEHPDTWKSMRKLGLALSGQQRYIEAEQIQRKALALSEKVSGSTNPSTLRSRSALAQTLRAQLKYAESEQIHLETLAIKEKVLGADHQDTLMSVYWLAELAHDQIRYEDALPLYERAYTGFLEAWGPDHPNSIQCLQHYTWIQRVVEEDQAVEIAKAEREAANATNELTVLNSQGPSTVEVALRPQERLRQKLKRWRIK